jgi:hypothetical protein
LFNKKGMISSGVVKALAPKRSTTLKQALDPNPILTRRLSTLNWVKSRHLSVTAGPGLWSFAMFS